MPPIPAVSSVPAAASAVGPDGPGGAVGAAGAVPDSGRGGLTTIRLLLADDQALIRSALAALLALEDDFRVVAEVGRGDQVVAAARANHPDVALLDIEMPGTRRAGRGRRPRQEVPATR